MEGPFAPAQVGDEFRTVLVGFPIAGVVALWEGDTVSYWRVEEAEKLVSLLGTGATARAAVGDNRFREAGLFDPKQNSLALTGRYPNAEGRVGGTFFRFSSISARKAHKAAQSADPVEFFVNLGERALGAAGRGEYLEVAAGGWQFPPRPSVLMGVARGEGGDWNVHLEAVPAPRAAPLWSEQTTAPGDEAGQLISFPATRDYVLAGGQIAGLALLDWQIPLLDVGLSFGESPFGAWSPEALDETE